MQLTFIVAVNMMGSGIIMLPTNMAQVGAISLLSWVVTAVGSMAIAYGFAQAGVFNQRTGGMAAYAEDAYGKIGYFQVFLPLLPVARDRQRGDRDLGGRLPRDVLPVADRRRRSRPASSVIALLWLTTVANFGRPERDRQDRLDHGVGRDHPGRRDSRSIGWFWFSTRRPSRRPGIRRA